MAILKTERLSLREFCLDDAEIVLSLLNDPQYIANIGDRGIRDLQQAQTYLLTGPIKSYRENNFGLYAIQRHGEEAVIGMCGLIKRDALSGIDLGYALFPEARRQGYAREAAARVVEQARVNLKLETVLAIVDPTNKASIQLLEALAFNYQRNIRLTPDDDPVGLYALTFERME
ncbi:MAG: GNAT family N-acetyltransferase [Halioglobus sp.]